jgi:hypothetical protein
VWWCSFRAESSPGIGEQLLSARITAAIRRSSQRSQESLQTLAKRHNLNPKTVANMAQARARVKDASYLTRAPTYIIMGLYTWSPPQRLGQLDLVVQYNLQSLQGYELQERDADLAQR